MRGAYDAGIVATAQGGSVTWLGPQTYDNLGPDAAKLIRTALSQKPDAIVAPDWVPEAQDEALKAVVAAGVPLIISIEGVDEKTVYRLVKRRELPGFKVAGAWRFKRTDIESWIERQKAAES
jgi:excisionase family DNA binding protein